MPETETELVSSSVPIGVQCDGIEIEGTLVLAQFRTRVRPFRLRAAYRTISTHLTATGRTKQCWYLGATYSPSRAREQGTASRVNK